MASHFISSQGISSYIGTPTRLYISTGYKSMLLGKEERSSAWKDHWFLVRMFHKDKDSVVFYFFLRSFWF